MIDAAIPPELSGSGDATGKVKKLAFCAEDSKTKLQLHIWLHCLFGIFNQIPNCRHFFLLLTNFKSISYIFVCIIHHCTSGNHLFRSISVCYEHELDMNM